MLPWVGSNYDNLVSKAGNVLDYYIIQEGFVIQYKRRANKGTFVKNVFWKMQKGSEEAVMKKEGDFTIKKSFWSREMLMQTVRKGVTFRKWGCIVDWMGCSVLKSTEYGICKLLCYHDVMNFWVKKKRKKQDLILSIVNWLDIEKWELRIRMEPDCWR